MQQFELRFWNGLRERHSMNSFISKNYSLARVLLLMAIAGIMCVQIALGYNTKSFEIRFQELVEIVPHSIANGKINQVAATFVGYYDKRCPDRGVICEHPPPAKAWLLISGVDCSSQFAKQLIEVVESGYHAPKLPNNRAFGYQFFFSKLTPERSLNRNFDPRDYRLTVRVEPDSNAAPCKNSGIINDIK